MRYFLILMILFSSTEQLMAEDITARDFAAGYYLEVGKKNAVYSLELPADVYRTVMSADLKDIRVFNGAGEVVEHDFRIVKNDSTKLREKKPSHSFPSFRLVCRVSWQNFRFRFYVIMSEPLSIFNLTQKAIRSIRRSPVICSILVI